MPTHEWTMAGDDYGSPQRPRRKTGLIITLAVLAVLIVAAALYDRAGPAGTSAPSVGGKSYQTSVNCQVNTVGSQGTVTITGTITGDASSYSVTVEVLDAATQAQIGTQTFEVQGTTTFTGTTPALLPIGPAGIDCKITQVV
ncbi:hypothetical protein GCM10009554_20310 [Kribbella koreensis]|uniref:DUF4307 domain-containing protein n=2 Tax=Kribbella TaxID=182639 RepID=A0ABP6Y2V6_9ACTN